MLTKFKSKVVGKKIVDTDVVLLTLLLEDPPEIDFTPGQYVLLNVPRDDRIYLKHFSIASTPDQKDKIELVVKIVPNGVASMYVQTLNTGDEVIVSGPAGMFLPHESGRDKIFLATGTGIAPIKSMIKSTFRISYFVFRVSLFWGLRHYKDLYFFEEFKKLAEENPSFDFRICLSQEKDFEQIPEEDRKHFIQGRVNMAIQSSTFDIPSSDFYVCGHRESVESIRQFLYEKGALKEQVFFEKF